MNTIYSYFNEAYGSVMFVSDRGAAWRCYADGTPGWMAVQWGCFGHIPLCLDFGYLNPIYYDIAHSDRHPGGLLPDEATALHWLADLPL